MAWSRDCDIKEEGDSRVRDGFKGEERLLRSRGCLDGAELEPF
jgi:hypothetical protein